MPHASFFYADSFIKCLLSIYHVPGIVPSAEMSINKQANQKELNSPGVLHLPFIWVLASSLSPDPIRHPPGRHLSAPKAKTVLGADPSGVTYDG